MKCPECRFNNRKGVKFCEECGARLELECPACKIKIPPDTKFCGECGQDLQKLPDSQLLIEKFIGDAVMAMFGATRTHDEKPFLMGHSMGGLLAQMLGARGLARGLVLLTPASPSGINALKYSVIKSFWSILTSWGFWRNPHRT